MIRGNMYIKNNKNESFDCVSGIRMSFEKNIKRLVESKKGSVDILIMSLFAILVLNVLFMFLMSNYKPIVQYENAQNICRQYMLKTEEDGYLTSDEKDSMNKTLKSIGINDADFSGTTLSQVTYGQTVTIKIKFTLKIKVLTTNNGLIPSFGYEDISSTISKNSTSTRVVHYTN